MKKILLFALILPNICFSQLTTFHVMRALNGTTFDVRTVSPNIPNGQILVGNVSGIGTSVTMSGDATINNAGVLSLNPLSPGYSKWTATGANIYRLSLVGIGQSVPTYDLDIRGVKGLKLTTANFGAVSDPGSVANDFVSMTPRGFDLTMDAQMISSPFTPPSLGIAVAVSRPQPATVLKNAGSGAALLIADGEVGILNPSPVHPLDVTGDINTTTGLRVAGTGTAGNYLRGNGTKFVPSGLIPADLTQSGASTGNVLGWNGTTWLPVAFSGESTKIGVFRNTGNARGAVMSGDSVVITSATPTQPGAVNLITQTFQAGNNGFKTFTSDNGFQVSADDSGATKAAGYQYTENSGSVVLAQTVSASPDANNAGWDLKVRESAALENQIRVSTNGPLKGVYTRGRSFSDLKEVGGTSYNIGDGDNAIILGPSVIVVNLQEIGPGALQTPNGGDLYIYNPNAASCTITPQAGQDIDGSSTLVLAQNKGVFLKAVSTASYTMWITIGN